MLIYSLVGLETALIDTVTNIFVGYQDTRLCCQNIMDGWTKQCRSGVAY